jgi:uncharacterized peroxidase-related enzyme
MKWAAGWRITVMSNVRSSPQLHLPAVESTANHEPGPYQKLIAEARRSGVEYSKIWDLFAFRNEVTVHLARFSHAVMRQPASITPAMRELIAAYTSYQNECGFCTKAHAATAAALLNDEALVWQALRDVDRSPLSDKDKLLLRFVGKVTKDLPAVQADDVARLREAGWDDEAIYFAITACALFNFYNRWITATGVPEMSEDAHRQQGESIASRGYARE